MRFAQMQNAECRMQNFGRLRLAPLRSIINIGTGFSVQKFRAVFYLKTLVPLALAEITDIRIFNSNHFAFCILNFAFTFRSCGM